MRSRELERAVAVGPSARAACATTEAGGKGLLVWTEPTPAGCSCRRCVHRLQTRQRDAGGAASGEAHVRAWLRGCSRPPSRSSSASAADSTLSSEAAGAQVLKVEAMRSCGGSMSRCGQLGGSRGLGEARARTNLLRMSIEQSSAPYRPAHLSFR